VRLLSQRRRKALICEIPTGVAAAFVVEGRVIAHVTDFHRSTPGGFTLQEAQESRAKARLGAAVIRELCSSLLFDSLDQYDCERMMNKIRGGKVYVFSIGPAPTVTGNRNVG
jgi:hypothetical protein